MGSVSQVPGEAVDADSASPGPPSVHSGPLAPPTPVQRSSPPTGTGRPAGESVAGRDSGARAVLGRVRRSVRRHAVFAVLFIVAVAARVLVLVAYPPALMYLGDSAAYLDQAWRDLWPGDWRPSGYPIFLRILDGPSHVTRIVVVQHLLTLAVAVALYAVALRAVRRPWLAALAAAPALLAPWVLDLGQFVLADSLFGVLVSAGVAVLAGWRRPQAVA
ncbi:hypothetical protein ND748_25470, partial [Frankia sp. AiPs1]|nr:hypothetical protein [Frankia sp. AiPs1]